MENEWRVNKPSGKGNGAASKKDVGDKGREVLDGLQGNVYRERQQEQVVYSTGEEPKKRRKTRAEVTEEPKGNVLRDKDAVNELNDKKAKTEGKEKKVARKEAGKRPNILIQVLNGDILTRDFVVNNLTFIFFFLFLLLLVVGKGYYGKQLAKDIETLQTDVNARTAEYIENKARLEEMTTRYRLVEALERRGLKESLKPAKVIRIKPKEK